MKTTDAGAPPKEVRHPLAPKTDALQTKVCDETDCLQAEGKDAHTEERLQTLLQEAYELASEFEYDLAAATEQIATAKRALMEVMRNVGFSTGHGDTFTDLYNELEWQIKELKDRPAEQIAALRHERNVLQKICAERSDEIAALKAVLTRPNYSFKDRCEKALKILDAARGEEIPTLKANAERYQQLRTNGAKRSDAGLPYVVVSRQNSSGEWHAWIIEGDELDLALNAERGWDK